MKKIVALAALMSASLLVHASDISLSQAATDLNGAPAAVTQSVDDQAKEAVNDIAKPAKAVKSTAKSSVKAQKAHAQKRVTKAKATAKKAQKKVTKAMKSAKVKAKKTQA